MSINACQFSVDRKYRYSLTRTVREELGPECVFIGLNPSTADEEKDDPTIRRCIGFAREWGYQLLTMLNIFAFRSTDPKKLRLHWLDPIGPENDYYLRTRAGGADLVICAWGAHGELHRRGDKVRKLLADYHIEFHHLGLTSNGQPKHPLYLPANTKPIKWV